MKKLSIIVPVYNSKELISKTLSSLINQTYRDFQIIFIDDGSTDGSADFIGKFLSDSSISFRIVRTENQGVSHARNLGMNLANSTYILFLDSDDHIELNMLEIMINSLDKDNLDLVWCAYDHEKSETVVWEYFKSYSHITGIIGGLELLDYIFDNTAHIITSNVIYKKGLFEDLRFNENFSYHEDLDLYYRAISKADRVSFISETLSHYVIRDDSLSHKLTYHKLREGVAALSSLYDYLKNQKFDLAVVNKIKYLVIPRTIFVFFNYFALKEKLIKRFRNDNYFTMMKKYKLVNINMKAFNLYAKIKIAAIAPQFYTIIKKVIYLKNKGRP